MSTLTHCPHCGQALNSELKSQIKVKTQSKPVYADMPIEAQIMAGVEKIYIPKSEIIKNSLREYFRLTPNFKTKFNREWMEWAVSVNVDADSLENAAEVWKMDKRFNWQIPNLKGIQEHWEELSSLFALLWVQWESLLKSCGKNNSYTREEFEKKFSFSIASVYVDKYGEDISVKPIEQLMNEDEFGEFLGLGLIRLLKNG